MILYGTSTHLYVINDLQNIVKIETLLSRFTGMEVVELFFTCLTLTFLNRSGNPATGLWQHLEKIQCMFSSELFLFMAF